MTNAIPDDKPVKITVELPTAIHRDHYYNNYGTSSCCCRPE